MRCLFVIVRKIHKENHRSILRSHTLQQCLLLYTCSSSEVIRYIHLSSGSGRFLTKSLIYSIETFSLLFRCSLLWMKANNWLIIMDALINSMGIWNTRLCNFLYVWLTGVLYRYIHWNQIAFCYHSETDYFILGTIFALLLQPQFISNKKYWIVGRCTIFPAVAVLQKRVSGARAR